MSVRATESLVGDLVVVNAFPKSPQMVVKAVNAETKIVTTSWFIAGNEYQEGTFPAASLDRVEAGKPTQARKPAQKKEYKKMSAKKASPTKKATSKAKTPVKTKAAIKGKQRPK